MQWEILEDLLTSVTSIFSVDSVSHIPLCTECVVGVLHFFTSSIVTWEEVSLNEQMQWDYF